MARGRGRLPALRVVQWVDRCGPNSQGSNLSVKITLLEHITRHFGGPETQVMTRTWGPWMSSSLEWYVDLHSISFVQ